MRFIFFLIFAAALNARVSVERANTATDALNAQTFTPKTTMASTAVANTPAQAPQNSLRIIEILQAELDRLKQKDGESLPSFAPDRPLHPSDKNDSIPALRQILYSLGYLQTTSDSPFFDMELEEAVKAFQAQHCIDTDGIIGKNTEERLNWCYTFRIKMLNESLEKLQQLVFTDRTVIVNVPTCTLHAFDGKKLKMCMKVIVGKPERPTPQITSYIDAIEFNPKWVIPRTILFKDKIPEIVRNMGRLRAYFKENNFQVFAKKDGHKNDAEPIDPQKVDWEEVDEHNFPYILRQESGPQNALGRIKFDLEDADYIYLHDTPKRDLFEKHSRFLSSGCIRVEKPKELAAWMLDESIDLVAEAINTEETETIELNKNVTAHVIYIPVLVSESGKILWGENPYNLNPQPQC